MESKKHERDVTCLVHRKLFLTKLQAVLLPNGHDVNNAIAYAGATWRALKADKVSSRVGLAVSSR
jgi:hypothetical protein